MNRMPQNQVHELSKTFRVPERELHAKGHGLGVHAVRATNHRCAAMFGRSPANRLQQRVDVVENDVAGLSHLQGECGIEHVGRGQTEMQPPGRRTDALGHSGRKRDHVVLRRALDLVDAGGIHAGLLPQRPGVGFGDDARRREGVGGREFDVQPRLITPGVGPNRAHLRVGIPGNHECQTRS